MHPLEHYIFQQDGAPCHTSVDTRSFLQEHDIPLMEWPSMSPDLNPIENMCHLLKTRLCKNYKSPAKNMDELFDRAADVWYSISKEECRV